METDAARRLIPTRATIAYGTEKVNLFFPAEHPADTYDRALELLGAMFLLQGVLSVIQMRHFSIESIFYRWSLVWKDLDIRSPIQRRSGAMSAL